MSTQPTALAEFQRQRTATHREAVSRTIRTLNASCEAISVSAVAAGAGVDRSYIYDHPDLLDEIRQLRGDSQAVVRRPIKERGSQASLQARLATAHAELARLRAENRDLRHHLENALGAHWDAQLTPASTAPVTAAASISRQP
jgi:Family of unknown function (DUF6262)